MTQNAQIETRTIEYLCGADENIHALGRKKRGECNIGEIMELMEDENDELSKFIRSLEV